MPRDSGPSKTHTPRPSLPTAAETKCSLLLNVMLMNTTLHTWVIRKVSTVCAYLSRILETVTLRMCSDFLYHLRSHRRHFVKFVLCLCLFLCVKHV